jgi:hypothetical protein
MQQLLQQLPLDKTFDLYRVGTGPAQPGGRVSVRMRVEPAGGQQEGAAGESQAAASGQFSICLRSPHHVASLEALLCTGGCLHQASSR